MLYMLCYYPMFYISVIRTRSRQISCVERRSMCYRYDYIAHHPDK